MGFNFNFLKRDDKGNLVEFFVDYCKRASDLTGLAIEIGINKIADTIAKSGFMVICEHDHSKTDIDYILNVKPNVNQNAVDFWKQAVARMIREPDGCLIVQLKSGIFIANSWTCDNSVTTERTYSNITIDVDGNTMRLNKRIKSSDVVHLRYSNPKLLKLLSAAGGNLDELLSMVFVGYKAMVPKIKVSINGQPQLIDSESGNPITTNQYAEKIAEKLSSGEIKSIVSGSGIEVSTIDMKSTLSTNDIEKLKECIFGIVASALGIPKSILLGDTIAQSNDEFLTYAVDPVSKIVTTAVCGTWITKDEYMAGDRILVRNWCVKHIDLIDSAVNIDKLLANGMTWNEIYDELGRPRVNEPWANTRRFTLNYAEEGGE